MLENLGYSGYFFGEMISGGFRPPLPTLTIIEVSWLDIEQRRSKMPH